MRRRFANIAYNLIERSASIILMHGNRRIRFGCFDAR
jgi:hypothetical protein